MNLPKVTIRFHCSRLKTETDFRAFNFMKGQEVLFMLKLDGFDHQTHLRRWQTDSGYSVEMVKWGKVLHTQYPGIFLNVPAYHSTQRTSGHYR